MKVPNKFKENYSQIYFNLNLSKVISALTFALLDFHYTSNSFVQKMGGTVHFSALNIRIQTAPSPQNTVNGYQKIKNMLERKQILK